MLVYTLDTLPLKREPIQAWCSVSGHPTDPPMAQEYLHQLTGVMHGSKHMSPEDIRFPDPKSFVAGTVDESRLSFWEWMTSVSPTDEREAILKWVKEGVKVDDFFKPFTGTWKGTNYKNKGKPPTRIFHNHKLSTKEYKEFVTNAVKKEVASGARLCVGRVKNCKTPPTVVSPTGLEPDHRKWRKIDDCRYLNLWCPPPKYHLQGFQTLARWISKLAAIIDIVSCFFNIRLHHSSYKYFGTRAFIDGIEYYLVSTVLVFGWSCSPYINQMLMNAIGRFLWSLTIEINTFTDDSALSPRRKHKCDTEICNNNCTVVIVCLVFLNCGFWVGLKKSTLFMAAVVRYLGMIIDLERRLFIVPDDKWETFMQLWTDMLQAERVGLAKVEKLAGKCAYFSVIIPGGLAYTKEMYQTITLAKQRESKDIILSADLIEEMAEWFFLLPKGYSAPFLSEDHISITVDTDASDYKWGGTAVWQGQQKLFAGSHFDSDSLATHINVKEAYAILQTLKAVTEESGSANKRVNIAYSSTQLRDGLYMPPPLWVMATTDSESVCSALKKGASRSKEINEIIKLIYSLARQFNLHLLFRHILGIYNTEPDGLTREDHEQDRGLIRTLFNELEMRLGKFTVDGFAQPFNAKCERFISRYVSEGCLTSNFFTWSPNDDEFMYLYPPMSIFHVVVPFLTTLITTRPKLRFALLSHDNNGAWFPMLQSITNDSFRIARKGDIALRGYDKKSKTIVDMPTESDIWAFVKK